ncbi:MAG: hypothetical protein NVS9B4_15350 [Candidatus Acidiferrum sp.]
MKKQLVVAICGWSFVVCSVVTARQATPSQGTNSQPASQMPAAHPPQDKSKRPSPPAHASCTLTNGNSVNVDYSSPRAKGRKIFGGLVPYGQVWRAGANEATTLVTKGNLTIGGQQIPEGTYTLFAIPEANKWTLVISKKTGEWGVPYPGADSDFARVDMTATTLPSPVENFTIGFNQSGGGCTLHMDWETTSASVDIK